MTRYSHCRLPYEHVPRGGDIVVRSRSRKRVNLNSSTVIGISLATILFPSAARIGATITLITVLVNMVQGRGVVAF